MPPDVAAPAPVSVAPAFISNVVVVGTAVTINFLSQKVVEEKLEPVIAENVDAAPNNIMSHIEKLCALENVRVTVDCPLVVLNALVIAVPDGFVKGCMS